MKTIRIALWSAILIVVLLSFCSCNNYLHVRELPQLYKQIISSVVTVKGIGSGILISNKYVLTVNHVAVRKSEHIIELSNGLEIPATVYAQNGAKDLALLKIDFKAFKVPKLKLETDPKIGEIIFTIGSPYLKSGTITMGILSRRPDRYDRTPWVCNIYLSDTLGDVGSSGSPVFNLQGKLIGIISGNYRVFAVIIPSQFIYDFFKTNGIVENKVFKW